MKVEALSRAALLERAAEIKPTHALISIRSPGCDWFPLFVAPTLELIFDDLDRHPMQSFRSVMGRDPVLFSSTMARNVISWLWQREWGKLWVHCDAGLSRSPAIARFVAESQNHSLLLSQHARPNTLVHGLLWKAVDQLGTG